MLGAFWRLRAKWVADQTLTFDNAARIAIGMIPWKMTAGAMTQGLEITEDLGFSAGETIAPGDEVEGAVVTNTSDKNIGVTGQLKVIADADSTDGTMYLYLEQSSDNSVWPSDEADFDIDLHCTLICALTMSTTAVDQGAAKNFEF